MPEELKKAELSWIRRAQKDLKSRIKNGDTFLASEYHLLNKEAVLGAQLGEAGNQVRKARGL